MQELDIFAIGLTNFISVYLAVLSMRVADRMRKRRLAKMILDELGERADTDQAFRDIVSKNFKSELEDPEDRS